MSAYICRTCGNPFAGRGKARYCSDECRHGTDAGYGSGCTCAPCKAAHARNHKRLRCVPAPRIPGLGTHRRIQALMCLGWSTADLSQRIGRHRSYLLKVMLRDTVEPPTAVLVAALYDELCMTRCTTRTAGRTAADALSRGWVPPLGWDDIDDRAENPAGWAYEEATRAELLEEFVEDRIGLTWACARLDINPEALQKWCGTHQLHHLYRALATQDRQRAGRDLEGQAVA